MNDVNYLSNLILDESAIDSKQIKKKSHDKTTKINKKPKGGYRPVLVIDQSQLINESIELKEKFQIINDECIQDSEYMSPQDIVSYYLICYLDQRYPNQFLENYNQIDHENQIKSKSIESLKFNFKNKNINLKLKNYKIQSLFDLVNCFSLHSVPHSARYTLVKWYSNKNNFNLKLFINQIPTSLEVLEMQAQSQRCVSLIADRIDCLVLNERDPLSFLLHDLVHAYKMFSNEYILKGQIGFYKSILKLVNIFKSDLNLMCGKDDKFKEEFDYLISDMNSHSKHLFYYFKACLINYFKRKFDLSDEKFLSNESLDEFNRLFESFIDVLGMNSFEKNLARNILFENTNKDQQSVNFIPLDNFFINFK
ncbi:unnamed protein product [Brachionus calyciflorus]|uniref:Uncharacterized protein n=1 Tax=Brachionus calyciflorus TaxID=104777 RepID=A0A813Y379_9BILA|nr:unnamed protein product [Brachionus calyciflorus]